MRCVRVANCLYQLQLNAGVSQLLIFSPLTTNIYTQKKE